MIGSGRTQESLSHQQRMPHDISYRHARQNVIALLTDGPRPAGVPVPACPGWTVEDLVAHLVETCARMLEGFTGVPRNAPVPATTEGLLDEWAELGASLDPFLAGQQSLDSAKVVWDAFTHELDLRFAIGAPPPVGHPALPTAMGLVTKGLSASLEARGLPALRIEADGAMWVAGTGEPAATMRGGWYDVYRSLAGRRTGEQIAALSWDTDPRPWLPAFTWGPVSVPVQPTEPIGRMI